MGNSNTRQITVENNKDGVSESCNSTEGSNYNSRSSNNSNKSTTRDKNSNSLPTDLMTEEEYQQLKSSYDQKIAILQNKNAQLYGATIENFSRAVERVEEKYLKALKPPVCGDLQEKMVFCFKENNQKILNCSSDVDNFNVCMQQYRQSRTLTSG